MMDVGVARRICAMRSRWVCTDALVHKPQIVLDPHPVLNLQDNSGCVRQWTKRIVVNRIFDARSFSVDVVILYSRIFASVAQRFDRIVLREEAKTQWVGFPSNQSV